MTNHPISKSFRASPVGRLSAAAAGVALLLQATSARAGDEAAAEALFGEGKRLAAEGKYAEACPKFAESNRLDRGAGTLIHLADCYEKNHQSATAWATFKDAENAAQALGRADWQKLAADRAARLEPTLAKLTIRVDEPADKIEVTRDGSPTSSASWGTALPVDVGTHKIHASAPGRRAFDASVDVKSDGESVLIIVPRLAAGDGEASGERPGGGSTQKTLGFLIAGVGVAGVAVGTITGLMAIGENNDSKALCPTEAGCVSQAAVDANDNAKSLGAVSTIGFVVGGAALATGIVLVLTAPRSPEAPVPSRAIRLTPAGGPTAAGVALTGAF